MPVVTLQSDGKYAIEVVENCFITWWMTREHDTEHHFVRLCTPPGIEVVEVENGANFSQRTKH